MKTMNELLEQFEKEDSIWKEKIDVLSCKHKGIMDQITDDLSTTQVIIYIGMAMDVMKEMQKLDAKHKKFLLKWYKKIEWKIFMDTFKIMLHKGE